MLEKLKRRLGISSEPPCDIFGTCEAVYNRVILQGPVLEEKAISLSHKLHRINSIDTRSLNKG